jgi:flagellar biosynthesis/type III secretory pathway chaperone
MNTISADTSLETDIAALLSELSSVQDELLEVLETKRDLMAASDVDGISQLQPREEQLLERLDACHKRRAELLQSAGHQGLPNESLGQLVSRLASDKQPNLSRQVNAASSRMRLLQHQSITNWVLAQRTILHLSQLLEIIATGGQLQPTYGRDNSPAPSGALVDQEA